MNLCQKLHKNNASFRQPVLCKSGSNILFSDIPTIDDCKQHHYLGHCITYTYIQYMSGTYGRAVLISALSSNFSTVIVNNTCIFNHIPAEAFSTTLSPTIKIFLRTMNEITNVHKQNNIHLRRKVHFFQRLKLYRDLKTEK